MFGDLFKAVGGVVGSIAGIPLAALSVTLGCSEELVRAAVRAGCETKEEIEEWIEDNT